MDEANKGNGSRIIVPGSTVVFAQLSCTQPDGHGNVAVKLEWLGGVPRRQGVAMMLAALSQNIAAQGVDDAPAVIPVPALRGL